MNNKFVADYDPTIGMHRTKFFETVTNAKMFRFFFFLFFLKFRGCL